MKQKRFFAIIISIIVLFFSLQLHSGQKAAILPFDADNDKEFSMTATELFQSALFTTGIFSLIEREKLDIILKEQSLSLTGLTTSDANKIGGLLNADLVLLGKIVRMKDGVTLSSRAVDIKTGDIKFSDTVQYRVPSQMKAAVQVLVDGLKYQFSSSPSMDEQQRLLKEKQKLLINPNTRTPKGAAWRSALCPGLGQFYNKQTIAGIVFIGAESFMAMGLIFKLADIKTPQGEIPASAPVIGVSFAFIHALNILYAYSFSPYHKKHISVSMLPTDTGANRFSLAYQETY
jgi:TolB-like protein